MLVFLEQIADVVEDTNYRGINLLTKEELIVKFNDQNTSKLKVTGADFTLESLRLDDIHFQRPSHVEAAITRIRKAIEQTREFGTSLSNDLNIIQTRQDFSRNLINIHKAGASDLLKADLNEEGANLLSSQTRLELGTTALSLAGISQQSILEIFGTSSELFLNF
jgi:flagellin-like hook-associated protein FlgL